MKHFELIVVTCNMINQELMLKFQENEIWFISASIEKIVYGVDEMEIIFLYSPERYEYGQVMILKELIVKMEYDEKRMYSVTDVISFIENNFNEFQSDYTIHSLEEIVKKLVLFMSIIKKESSTNCENLFNDYLKKKYKNYYA